MTRQILICDDEPHVLEGLRFLLKSKERRIVTAPNGRRALELIESCTPDLLITDVMMPEMNGVELVAALRGRPATQNLPIIIVTARGQPDDAVVAQEVWGTHVIAKPFDPGALRELVSSILGDRACPTTNSA
jgi:CheY-like chemotaxis protein